MIADHSSDLTGGPFPEAAQAWVRALQQGLSAAERPQLDDLSEYASTSDYAPQTLKRIFASVLSMGRELGLMEQAMALLAGQEAALRQLRVDIGIGRAAAEETLPRAVVLVWKEHSWMSPGRWVPDVLDRAAAFDPLHLAVKGDLAWQEIVTEETGEVDHLFVMAHAFGDKPPSDAIHGLEQHIPHGRLHEIDSPSDWLSPGPGVMRAIFDAASRMHGVADLFST